jgi:nicotinate-nucleotide--dimethylbenzimidazole phosphoribosyltransferase
MENSAMQPQRLSLGLLLVLLLLSPASGQAQVFQASEALANPGHPREGGHTYQPERAREQELPGSEKEAGPGYTHEQEYLFRIFETRRSVRDFKSTPIPDEHILKILDIAHTAPTSGNQQPWKFLVIRDREKLGRLKEESVSFILGKMGQRRELSAEDLEEKRGSLRNVLDKYLSAPVYIVVLVDSNSQYPDYNRYDGSLAAGYLFIAARALGYGTVFCTDTFPFDVVKRVFEVPDHYEVICSTPVGIPVSWPEPPPKKHLDELVVFETLDK